jgi:hypothetical protein
MNTSSFVDVSVLVEDTNDLTSGGLKNPASSDNGHITDLVVVYALNMDSTVRRLGNDTHILPC